MRRLALAALLALAACDRPPAEDRRGDAPGYAEKALAPYPGVKLEYYLVEGVTPEALFASMRERQLVGEEKNGRFAVGVTRYNVQWSLQGRSDGSCDTSLLNVFFDVTVFIPQLANENASPEVRRKWGNFVADVVAHEAEHVRIIYEYKPKIIAAMASATCATAQAEGEALVAEMKAANDRFDEEDAQRHAGLPVFY
jgi:predicted secreted Zn-dependent protease